jgi:uncharacterized protein YecE (DUF72 family)
MPPSRTVIHQWTLPTESVQKSLLPTYDSAMDRPFLTLPAQCRVGTIGFSYDDWQPAFYPPDTRKGERLAAYASAFDTVELDTTFHGIPPIDRVAAWADAVPPGFVFCPKTPRLITHETGPAAALPLMLAFIESLAPMHDAGKLGPILVQFPPTFGRHRAPELDAFLGKLPETRRYALEFRHASWLHPSTSSLLARHRCAWVGADYSVKPWPLHHTTDFLYLRFVGKHHRYPTFDHERFDPTLLLEEWLERVAHLLTGNPLAVRPNVFVLIADDYAGHAPATANRFRRLVRLPVRGPILRRFAAAQGSLF